VLYSKGKETIQDNQEKETIRKKNKERKREELTGEKKIPRQFI
jgi:hypothetical protein